MTDSPRLLTTQSGRVLMFNNPPRHFFDEQMSVELDELMRKLALRSTLARDLVVLGRIYASLRLLNQSDKVIGTAVNGLALGMGCVFALACDIRLMADDQQIDLPRDRPRDARRRRRHLGRHAHPTV